MSDAADVEGRVRAALEAAALTIDATAGPQARTVSAAPTRRRRLPLVLAAAIATVVVIVAATVAWPSRAPTPTLPSLAPGTCAPLAGVVALDGRGRPRWATPVTASSEPASRPPAAIRVDDEVVTAVGRGVTGLGVADGRVRWSVDLEAQVVELVEAPSGPVAVTAGEQAFPQVTLLDPADGRPLWVWRSPSVIAGAPVIVGGVVVVTAEGGTIALDAVTGEVRWTAPPAIVILEAAAYQVAAGSGATYVANEGEVVVARDAASGGVLWQVPSDAHLEPVIASDLVLLRSTFTPFYGPSHVTDRLTALDLRTGATRWSAPVDTDVWDLAITPSGALVTAFRELLLFDLRTGGLRWRVPADAIANERLEGRLVPPLVIVEPSPGDHRAASVVDRSAVDGQTLATRTEPDAPRIRIVGRVGGSWLGVETTDTEPQTPARVVAGGGRAWVRTLPYSRTSALLPTADGGAVVAIATAPC